MLLQQVFALAIDQRYAVSGIKPNLVTFPYIFEGLGVTMYCRILLS